MRQPPRVGPLQTSFAVTGADSDRSWSRITTEPRKWNLPAWLWWRLGEPQPAHGPKNPVPGRSRVWAGLSSVVFAVAVAGVLVLFSFNEPWWGLLALLANLAGAVTSIVAVAAAHDSHEPKLWPRVSLTLNLLLAAVWVLFVLALAAAQE